MDAGIVRSAFRRLSTSRIAPEMFSSGGVRIKLAPRAAMIFLRSSLMFSGMTMTT